MDGPGYDSGRLILGPVGLITQRSQVQILSPLLRAEAVTIIRGGLSCIRSAFTARLRSRTMVSHEKTISKPALG